jgi:hypothetical protein
MIKRPISQNSARSGGLSSDASSILSKSTRRVPASSTLTQQGIANVNDVGSDTQIVNQTSTLPITDLVYVFEQSLTQ